MPKKKKSSTAKKAIGHEDIKKITRPAFISAIYAATINLAVTLFVFIKMYIIDNMQPSTGIVGLWTFISFLVVILTFIGAYMLRQEHHNLAGSIMILTVNIIGLCLVSGLFIGPFLGTIAGIMAINEHEKLIKHNA